MKYTVTHRYVENRKWNITNGDVKSDVVEIHTTEDLETCKEILNDYVDPPRFELTDDNIRREFGDKIRAGAYSQIRHYYGFRKQIYGDFLEDLKKGLTGIFRYDIPEEASHFELYDPKDGEDEKQLEYYIELKIEK